MASIRGLDEFNRKLAALPVAAKDEMAKALDESADRLIALQRAVVSVDSGETKASIRKEPGRHELQIDVKAGGPATTKPVRQGVTAPAVDYALIEEFGTPEHPARPFFYPPWRALKRAIKLRLGRAYRTAAKKVGVSDGT